MASNALVKTRIDTEVRDRASAVLESMGLTVSDGERGGITARTYIRQRSAR